MWVFGKWWKNTKWRDKLNVVSLFVPSILLINKKGENGLWKVVNIKLERRKTINMSFFCLKDLFLWTEHYPVECMQIDVFVEVRNSKPIKTKQKNRKKKCWNKTLGDFLPIFGSILWHFELDLQSEQHVIGSSTVLWCFFDDIS